MICEDHGDRHGTEKIQIGGVSHELAGSLFKKLVRLPTRNVCSATSLQAKSEDDGLVCANVSGLL